MHTRSFFFFFLTTTLNKISNTFVERYNTLEFKILFTYFSRRLYDILLEKIGLWFELGAQLSTTQVVMFMLLPIACFIFSSVSLTYSLHFGSVVVTVKWKTALNSTTASPNQYNENEF